MFLPDDGSGPIPEPDLQIDIVHTAPDFVWLKNNVVLLPRNAFDVNTRFVDDVKALMREDAKTRAPK